MQPYSQELLRTVIDWFDDEPTAPLHPDALLRDGDGTIAELVRKARMEETARTVVSIKRDAGAVSDTDLSDTIRLAEEVERECCAEIVEAFGHSFVKQATGVGVEIGHTVQATCAALAGLIRSRV